MSASTTLSYTTRGDLASTDGPLAGSGDTTTYRYNDARQIVGVIGPDPDGGGPRQRRAQRLTYNARGAVALAEVGTVAGLTDPQWASFSSAQDIATDFDGYGRVTHRRARAGGVTYGLAQASYDGAGRVECVATRMNSGSFASPPNSACTPAAAGAFGPDRIAKYGYDALGRMNTTTIGVGLLNAITEGVTYTANGKPASKTDGAGNVSTMTYDGFDRLKRLNYPNASGGGTSTSDYEEYGYDAGGNVVTNRTRAGEIFTTTYDRLGRPTFVDAPATANDTTYT